MSQPLVSVGPDASLGEMIDCMSRHGIRRLPVLEGGELIGLASLDDLLIALTQQLAELGQAARRQFQEAQRSARRHKLRDEIEARVEGFVEQLESLGGQTRDALTRELGALRDRLRNRGGP
jgi:signal-transduction protein with cAMP-binding, CBS, and nucleotidyltransferase domain